MTAHSLAHQGVLERLRMSLPSLFQDHSHEPFGEQRMVLLPQRKPAVSPQQFLRNMINEKRVVVYGPEEDSLVFPSVLSEVPERRYGVLPMNHDIVGAEMKWLRPGFLSKPSRPEDFVWFLDQLIQGTDRTLLPSPDYSLVFLIQGSDDRLYMATCISDPEPFQPSWLLLIGLFSEGNQWAAGCQLVCPAEALV